MDLEPGIKNPGDRRGGGTLRMSVMILFKLFSASSAVKAFDITLIIAEAML
jgi:hypothetical protein